MHIHSTIAKFLVDTDYAVLDAATKRDDGAWTCRIRSRTNGRTGTLVWLTGGERYAEVAWDERA